MAELDFTEANLVWYDPGEWPSRDFVFVGSDLVVFLCSDTVPALRKFVSQSDPFGTSPTDVTMRLNDSPGNESDVSMWYEVSTNKIWAVVSPPAAATRLLRFNGTTMAVELRCFPGHVVSNAGSLWACMRNHNSGNGVNYAPGTGGFWAGTWEELTDSICDNADVTVWTAHTDYQGGGLNGPGNGNAFIDISLPGILIVGLNYYGSKVGIAGFDTNTLSYLGLMFGNGNNSVRPYVYGDYIFLVTLQYVTRFDISTFIETGSVYRPGSEGEYLEGVVEYDGIIYISISDNNSNTSAIWKLNPETMEWAGMYTTTDVNTSGGPLILMFNNYIAAGLSGCVCISDITTETENLTFLLSDPPDPPQSVNTVIRWDGAYLYGIMYPFANYSNLWRFGPITLSEESVLVELASTYLWTIGEEIPVDTPNSAVPVKAFVWNEETKSFVIHDVDFLCHRDVLYTKIPYDIVGDSSGQILRFDDGFNTAAGLAIDGVVETADMTFDLPDQMKRISEVIPELKIQDQISELMIQVGVRNRLQDDLKWSDPVPFTIGVSERCDFNGFRKEGKYIRLRFYSDQLTSPWKMSGYTIKYEIAGTR
mgnify:CR=1 FL=1